MSKIRTGNVAGRAVVKLRAPLRKAPEGPSGKRLYTSDRLKRPKRRAPHG